MSIWYEVETAPSRFTTNSRTGKTQLVILGNRTGKTQPIILGSRAKSDQFVFFFRRRETAANTPQSTGEVDTWYRFYPLSPLTYADYRTAEATGLAFLECLELHTCDDLFRREPENIIRPKKLLTIPHPEFALCASVFHHSEAKFEVRYFADIEGSQESGWRVSAQVNNGDGLPLNDTLLTMADNLTDAQDIARREMETIILSGVYQIPKNGSLTKPD